MSLSKKQSANKPTDIRDTLPRGKAVAGECLCQITGKKSLRDIETGLKMQQNHWYHLGVVNAVRSTISCANSKRPYRIVEKSFYYLLKRCKDITPRHNFRFGNPLAILDVTVIEFCLSMFPWAKFRKRKGALKLHTLLDLRGTIPSFLVVTDAR